MQQQKKIRESNYELMRIVSMVMIIVFHIFIHGNLYDNSTGTIHILLIFLESLIIVHVNSFILITGYFQCDKKMKLSKFISINNSVWFYKVLFLIVFMTLGLINPSKLDVFKTFLPINYMDYWFAGLYIILYLLTPIVNTLIKNITKGQYQKILISLFFVTSILSTFTRQVAYDNVRGYSLINFIFLYLIGAYFKKYPIDKNSMFKNIKKNMRKLIFISIFVFLAFFNTILFFFSKELISTNTGIAQELGYIFSESFTSFCSPIVIIQSVIYFLFFGCLSFKSKIVNKIATCVFGIYLVHENKYLYSVMYKPLGFLSKSPYTYSVIIRIFIVTFLLFVTCWIMEFIRQSIFKFIYNLKISKKNRKFYRDYINSLGINLNW